MSVEVFEHGNFSGKTSGSIDRDCSYIGDFWNDKVSSIKVHSGTWDFFKDANFKGRSFRLKAGQYPSINKTMNDTISSFRRVAVNSVPAPSSSGVHKRVLDLTNIERSKVGLAPLTFNSQLAAAAQKHSKNMAIHDFFDHRQMAERVKAEGYQYSQVGENISAGQSTPESVVQGWMNSPGHRKNILNSGFRELGVGYYLLQNDGGSLKHKTYWTQVFGTPR